MEINREVLEKAAQEVKEPMIAFAQKIIQRRSDTGHEKETADAIYEEMQKLGFDVVDRDRTGNVIGILKGDGSEDALMFNCHMDQVDPGDLSAWEYDPFGGIIADGYIHGRGASDTKGTIATQIYLGAMLKNLNVKLKRDLIFTFVVEEEPGDMWGALRMCQDYLKDTPIAFCISGESTSMDIALGHRGKLEVQVISKGKNSHSSAPWLGINAVSKMAPMIEAIDEMAKNMPQDDIFKGSLSIINIECHPGFNCVVPDTCTINIDYRFLVDETVESILAKFQKIIDELEAKDPESSYEVRVRQLEHTSYTGVHEFAELNKPSFVTSIDNEYVQKTIGALKKVGQNPKTYYWDYGTDAAYFVKECGITCIGYSPAEEEYCHSPKDRIKISLMEEALVGYAAICEDIACE